MPFPILPVIGTRFGEVDTAAEVAAGKQTKFRLGHVLTADDGHDYVYAKASAAITASTVSILTEPAMTMAAGAGAWTSPATALALNDQAWFKKTAI